MLVVDPLPVNVIVPPLPEAVTVHDPEEGKPLSVTDPVATEHVAWVTIPGVGASGNAVTVTVALPVMVLVHEAVASTAVME